MTSRRHSQALDYRELGSSHFRRNPPSDKQKTQGGTKFNLNPAPYLALFSLVFLLLGVAHNIGIFMPLSEKLLLNITISDHIQTSIYIGLLVLILPLILAVLLLFLYFLYEFGIAIYSFTVFVFALARPTTNRYLLAKAAAIQKKKRLVAQLLNLYKLCAPIAPQLLAITFSAMLALLIRLAMPESLVFKFQGSFYLIFVLLFFAVVMLAISLQDGTHGFKAIYRQPLRHGMSIIILLVYSFQIGVFDSLRTHNYLIGEMEAQHKINDKPVQIIRTFEKGVFIAVRPSEQSPASVRFLPWKEVHSSDSAVVLEMLSPKDE